MYVVYAPTHIESCIYTTFLICLVITVQFESPEYAASEDQDMSVNVLLIGNIATSIVLQVVPENLTVVNGTMAFLPQDFPGVPESNPRLPVTATSKNCILYA